MISPLPSRAAAAHRPECPPNTRADGGYMLLTVVIMVAFVLVALSIAAPVIARDLRRDKEVESQHRAQQYVRAIRLYYRKTHNYPASLDALKQTNNIRFLRQEYVDPLTGKADWRIIHLGEQKTTVKGFFGQELGGLATGGLGSATGLGSGVGTPIGGTAAGSNTSTIGATSALTSGFSGATITSSTPGTAGSTGSTGTSGSSTGVGAIIGVGTARTGPSIASPNAQNSYETWEFWYDPRIEQMYQKGQTNAGIGTGAGSQTPSSLTNNGFGTPAGTTPGTTGGLGSSTTTSPTTSPSSTTSTSPQ